MWHDGYLKQARSDWDVYNMVSMNSVPDCHALHYLQMTTEKLGKALLLAGGTDIRAVRRTHRAFTRFLQIAAKNHRLQKELGMTGRQLQAHVQQFLPVAYEIEHLAPALADSGPNVEYPWEDPVGTVNVPARYIFPVAAMLREPKGRNLLKLVKTTLTRFYACFT